MQNLRHIVARRPKLAMLPSRGRQDEAPREGQSGRTIDEVEFWMKSFVHKKKVKTFLQDSTSHNLVAKPRSRTRAKPAVPSLFSDFC